MPTLQIEHGVRDYGAWKTAFDDDPVGREAGGVRGHRIMRPDDDPRYVILELDFATIEEAEAFRRRLRQLWEDIDTRLGLESPRARIVDVVESKEY
jgi:hypothetical protein